MSFLSKHKATFFITITLMSISLILFSRSEYYKPTILANGLGYIVTPIQSFFTGIGDFAYDKIYFYNNMQLIEEENIILKVENEELKAEQKRFTLIEEENIRLSELLELNQKYPNLEKVGANVKIIANDVSNWYDTFIIDKGAKNGMEKNMVVMANEGLVGIIIETYNTYSKVAPLIDDDANSIAAVCVRTGTLGFIRGDANLMLDGLCQMEHIPLDAEITEGDEIITSSLGNIYPPGITIGYVQEVALSSDNLTKYAIVKPAVDFEHLELVAIVNGVLFQEDN